MESSPYYVTLFISLSERWPLLTARGAYASKHMRTYGVYSGELTNPHSLRSGIISYMSLYLQQQIRAWHMVVIPKMRLNIFSSKYDRLMNNLSLLSQAWYPNFYRK